MRLGIIVQSDPLSNGGEVISGSGFEIEGFKIALVGDPVYCAIHGDGKIVEGDENIRINDIPTAFHDHQVSCGCKLVSNKFVNNFFSENTLDLLTKIDNSELHSSKNYICKSIKKLEDIIDNNSLLFDAFQLLNEITSSKKKIAKYLVKELLKKEISFELMPHVDYVCKNREKNAIEFEYQNEKKRIRMVYKPVSDMPKNFVCEDNLGGAHRNTKLPIGDKLDSHHMPAKSAYLGSPMYPDENSIAPDGPAVKMPVKHHKQTLSYGSKEDARQYHENQRQLVQSGKFEEAMQNDIEDLRRIATENGDPTKYECQIKQVIEYANTLDRSSFIIK